jgi:hypothetical protein
VLSDDRQLTVGRSPARLLDAARESGVESETVGA